MSAEANLLTVAEAAALLGVRPSWVYAQTCRRRIPFVKLGALVRFDRAELDKWVAAQKVPALPYEGSGQVAPRANFSRVFARSRTPAVAFLSQEGRGKTE